MKYAQLNFLGMSKIVIIEDNQKYYSVALPTQKIVSDIARKNEDVALEIVKYMTLIFEISLNKNYRIDENGPEYILDFSHVELTK